MLAALKDGGTALAALCAWPRPNYMRNGPSRSKLDKRSAEAEKPWRGFRLSVLSDTDPACSQSQIRCITLLPQRLDARTGPVVLELGTTVLRAVSKQYN